MCSRRKLRVLPKQEKRGRFRQLAVIGRGLVSVYKEAKAFESVFEPSLVVFDYPPKNRKTGLGKARAGEAFDTLAGERTKRVDLLW